MRDIIHFRSSSKIEKTGTWSKKMTRTRSSDFDALREYSEWDDARDIAWKQSAKSIGTFVRLSESEQSISLLLIGDRDDGWEFWLDDSRQDKDNFYKILKEQCRYTSHRTGSIFSENVYTSKGIEDISQELRKNKEKGNLILLMTGSLELQKYQSLIPLAKQNDIIIIHTLHPYERNPEKHGRFLMTSKTPKISQYLVSLRKELTTLRKELTKNNISLIEASTEDNPATLLNFFFKHRYDR